MKVMIWHTPRGIIDEGGKMLEGYINFNITLMAPPENDRMNVSAPLTPSHCDSPPCILAADWQLARWAWSLQHLQCPACAMPAHHIQQVLHRWSSPGARVGSVK